MIIRTFIKTWYLALNTSLLWGILNVVLILRSVVSVAPNVFI